MSRKRYIIVTASFLLVGLLGWGYLYTFHGKHRNIAKEVATADFQAPELLFKFQQGTAETHVDEVVFVTGDVTSIDQSTIVLNGMVQIDLLNRPDTSIQNGKSIKIKGRCVGYDDLLEVVKIDQATHITE